MTVATTEVRDVLLVRLSAMGDIVHALGAMQALARARPTWRLHVAVQREFAPLFAQLDWVASIVEHDRRAVLLGFARLMRRLRALRCDLALDLQGNWKSALAVRASGARRRIGIASTWRREPGSARLLNERIAASQPVPHPAHLALDVVRAVAPEAVPTPSRLVATEAEVEHEAAALRALGVDPELPFLLLVLGGPADNRSWPATSAAGAARACAWPAVVVAGPREPVGMPLPPGIPLLRHARGELRRLIALGALLARAEGRAIGPDQGVMHVLAACGADVTVLFGPQDPARSAPLRARVSVHPNPPACMPCRCRTCDHAQGPVCMRFEPDQAMSPAEHGCREGPPITVAKPRGQK